MSFEERLKGDFFDIASSLHTEGAEFIIVGAHAVGIHVTPRDGRPRCVGPCISRKCVVGSSRAATIRCAALDLQHHARRLRTPRQGVPPGRIDIITQLSGITFEEAWPTRVIIEVRGFPVPFLGREALIKNKRASARPKDLADVELLERAKL